MKPRILAGSFPVQLSGSLCLTFLLTSVAQAQTPISRPVHLVVQSEGLAKVRRSGWTGQASVVFGTSLQAEDRLNLDKASHVKVLCSDLTLRDLSSDTATIPCNSAPTVLHQPDGSVMHITRHGALGEEPYPIILRPRRTKLLSTHPTLHWTPVKNTSRYTVIVRAEGFNWSTVSSGTQVVYPEMAPKLKPGVDYKLIVETGTSTSSDEPGFGLGFSLLNPDEAKTVRQEQKQIESLGLPQGTTDFLIARIYADHGLFAEAIERLDGISEKFNAAAVKRFLGDLYMDIGLPREAEAYYQNSLKPSIDENDEEGQMVVHNALAYIYRQIKGNKDAAVEQLNATLELAKKLGDDSTISQVKKQLEELKSPIHRLGYLQLSIPGDFRTIASAGR